MTYKNERTILVINTSPYVSGAEISLRYILSKINRGFKIFSICGNPNFYNRFSLEIQEVDIKKYRLDLWIKSIIKSVVFLRKYPAQIIYFNTTKSFINLFPLVICFPKKKVVWHVRDNIKFKIVARILAYFTDKIICNSNFIKGQIGDSKKIKTIYNGVDTQKIIATCKKGLQHKTVACISQLTPWKNLEDYIEIAKKVIEKQSDVLFLIVGDYLNPKDRLYKEHIQSLIKKYNLEAQIELLGFKKNIGEVLNNIDVLCHTAKKEPFGRVIIEAMACEKSVIAYDSGGPSEIIAKNTGVLVPEGDIDQYAKELHQLLIDDVKRTKIGKAARKHVAENFTNQLYVRQIVECFDEVLV